jgi:succinate-semialdehyde dehydrogenase/glutarate-semialdehyde dehydrogenase
MAQAASQVKKLSLELGGHAPFIVCPDMDLRRAAEAAVKAKFRNNGQSCISPSRFYVPRDRARAFAEEAARLAGALRIGNGLGPGVEAGPLIDELRRAATEAMVEDIKRRGGTILCGGKRPSDPALASGYFYEPTVAADVTEEMMIFKEEPFAPILPVMAYDTVDEAIERANDTVYGLAAYAATNDMALMFKLADRLEAGVIAINETAPATPQAPFGGMKQSGIGREGGWQVLDAYTETKMVSIVL